MNEFENLALLLIKWLRANRHPHTTIIIDCDHAELLEGIHAVPFVGIRDNNQSVEDPRSVGSHD